MFKDLEEKLIRFREERDWKQFHSPRNLAASISIEAAELLEIFQWTDDARLPALVEARRSDIRDELADLCIYMITLAHDLDIDLRDAIEKKLARNAQRYPVETSRGKATSNAPRTTGD
ncbi:nucleotide pyrophosphohydrolase [Hyalangium gracile]|uniref:nucleotide pyrophosphohydrolase n=1 Tax=Hyalangium gracile TaxID=394092 RepID=UPI001CCF55BB|nr:nucleotide pyrophosphohydrolase [Hyalangium gracile]